jgi:Protein of unknown function (DUF2281)
MTLKERLIQEIESMPEELLEEVLDFASFIKAKQSKKLASLELQAKLTYRPASGRSILRHAGTWQGDDLEECLQMVYDTRSKAKFGEHINPFE